MLMNKTELRAKKWLKSQGYSQVTFQHRNSPDFVTNAGLGFEVKKVRENTIVFSSRQWEQLKVHPNVNILIYDSSELPEAIVPFKDLEKPPSYWGKYRLVIFDLNKVRYEEEAKEVKDVRGKLGLTQSEFARQLGVTFQTANRWEHGKTRPSRMAIMLMNELLAKGLAKRDKRNRASR